MTLAGGGHLGGPKTLWEAWKGVLKHMRLNLKGTRKCATPLGEILVKYPNNSKRLNKNVYTFAA